MLYHSISFKSGFFSQKSLRMICSTTAYHSNQDFSLKSALKWYALPQHIILKGILLLKVIQNDMLYNSISFISGFFSKKCFRMICSTTAYHFKRYFTLKSALEWYALPQHIILIGIFLSKVLQNDMLYHSISF